MSFLSCSDWLSLDLVFPPTLQMMFLKGTKLFGLSSLQSNHSILLPPVLTGHSSRGSEVVSNVQIKSLFLSGVFAALGEVLLDQCSLDGPPPLPCPGTSLFLKPHKVPHLGEGYNAWILRKVWWKILR